MMPSLTTLEVAGLILTTEFALVACVLPAWLLRRTRRQETLEAHGAQRLLDDVERAEPNRRQALETIFASAYKLEADEIGARVDEFIAREQAFYQVMTSVYLERDSRRLEEIPAELTKVIAPWLRMTPNNAIAAGTLETLAAENTALSAELGQTREHMEELMREYLKAFDKQAVLAATTAGVASASGEVVVRESRPADSRVSPELAPASAEGATATAQRVGGAVAVDEVEVDSAGDTAAATQDGSDGDRGIALADDDDLNFIDVSSDDEFDPVPLADADDEALDTDDTDAADALDGLFDEEIAALGAFDEEGAAAA